MLICFSKEQSVIFIHNESIHIIQSLSTIMISKEEKLKVLNEILKYNEFQASDTYKNLLTYLVQSSIRNEHPKEYNIAIDVFKKPADFNPAEDSTVRVYIGKLRKKLDRYYRNEGKKCRIRIEIPKGHYEVSFYKVTSKRTKDFILNPRFWRYFFILLLLSLVVFLSLRLYYLQHSVGNKHLRLVHHPFWASIIDSDLHKLFVLGDDFFFLEVSNDEETIIRKHYINTPEDLLLYRQKHREETITGQTPYPFIPLTSIKPLYKIFPLFKSDDNISIEYSSNLKASDLLKYEIIFIGTFRNLYLLNQAYNDIIQSSELGPGKNILKLNLPDTTFTITLSGKPGRQHSDFCIVRKVPGPNKNNIVLFTSFFISGITGATNYMTTPDKLKEIDHLFYRKYGYIPEFFDIIFKTTGHSRTAFSTYIIYLKEIDPNISIW